MRRLLLLVGAIIFVDTIFFAALTPLLPHYVDRFDLSKAGAGVLSAAYPAGVLLGGVPSGLATSRVGARATAVTGLLLVATTTVTFGFGDSIWLLDAARFAQGLGSACAWTAGLSWLVSAAPSERRGELIGTALAAAIVGALFGPVLGGVASLVGTGAAFTAVAALALVLVAATLATPPPPPSRAQPLSALARALRSGPVLGGIWFVLLPALLFGTMSVLGPLRLHALGFGAVAIGATWLLSAALEAVVNPLLGRLSDRHGRLLPLRGAVLASGVLTCVLPWPRSDVLLAALIVLAALSFGSFWTPALSLLADEAEHQGLEYGYAFALINLAWAPGQALGSSVGGALADATTDAVPYLALAALCLGTLAVLVRRAGVARPLPRTP